MESQKTLSSQNSLEKEELGYILHFLISKLQSYSIKHYGVGIKIDRHWNRIEKRRNKPSIYVHIIFGKGTKTIQWGKIRLLSKWCWESWISPYKWQKLDTYIIHKNQLRKQIQEVNVRTIKFPGEKWQNPHDIRFGKTWHQNHRQQEKKYVELHQNLKLCIKKQSDWKDNLRNGRKYLHIW